MGAGTGQVFSVGQSLAIQVTDFFPIKQLLTSVPKQSPEISQLLLHKPSNVFLFMPIKYKNKGIIIKQKTT